jgi:hypothetical protein
MTQEMTSSTTSSIAPEEARSATILGTTLEEVARLAVILGTTKCRCFFVFTLHFVILSMDIMLGVYVMNIVKFE